MSRLAIIILNKSNNNLLFQCINSIKKLTQFSNYHIYIGDTGSSLSEIEEIIYYIKLNFSNTKNVSLLKFNYYNFGKNNNEIVKNYLNGEDLLLFCNNDIELVNDCITDVIQSFNDKSNQIGTAGVKLLYKDKTIQHAGQILYLDKNKNYLQITHRGLRSAETFFSDRGSVIGNTGGFMFTKTELFLDIGGFNETYVDCFEDVEYNIQCLLKNKTNYYFGDKTAFHYESQTRDQNSQKNYNMAKDHAKIIEYITTHIDSLLRTNLPVIV